METTQDGRILSITTPLGKDVLLIDRFTATEEISKLFSIQVELVRRETEEGDKITPVEIPNILGERVTITVTQPDETTRTFNGLVKAFRLRLRDSMFSFYSMEVVPQIWLLTQIRQSRIFQHKGVPEILKEVLKGLDVKFELQGTYEPRNYCVQYRESDFNFISRLMEEEGIFYFFQHKGEKHTMIVADTPQSHRDCPSKKDIPHDSMVDGEGFMAAIGEWTTGYELQSGMITFWDHSFQLKTNKHEAQQPSLYKIGGNQKLEIYDYPGGYARKYDDIDSSGGERSDVKNISTDREKTAKIAMQALDAGHKTISGSSDCSSMTAGHRFALTDHPNSDFNGQYVITTITHRAEQSPSYMSQDILSRPYANSFRCVAFKTPFRPSREALKPTVSGSQTAMVVGPAGEEIFTDKFGRVKVQFHWDRQGKNDENSSCWVRVGTLWAGKQWGVIHIPRIGQEVIVDFLEGDPDQPIIVGSVWNPETMPSYELPANKTQSGVKSRSSKGGSPDNFNEFRFEDLKGSEEIYLHAEKNWTIMVENDKNQVVGHDETHLVKNDRSKTVVHDETTVVKHDRTETVQNNETITIIKNRTENVGEMETITIGKDRKHDVVGDQNKTVGKNDSMKVTQKMKADVGDTYTLTATNMIEESSKKIVVTAGVELVLQGPGGQIKIDAGGVTITGVLVKIN